MSTQYKHSTDVPPAVLIERLKALSSAVAGGRESVLREFTMRIPAETDRDADIVLHEAARRLAVLEKLLGFSLRDHIERQAAWSAQTFGPGARVNGITDHIAKELREIRESDGALEEWIDVVILALDGCWRSGATPAQIIEALVYKQALNEARRWPDWRTADPDKAIEHDRTADQAPAP